eukprot:CAMPEP_0175098702 /NCGR_PEP_ID=MMETSP0086_2-20121207/6013_1 /TAXON_ID=136419 /ORGANISM="Unknown Unknown, Strain D1" /LENGTH=282 /DNA_ID=CAMNT_0016372401 /DNA_START=13 /DNA_END=857 /DNA_ORIENTATION=-
MSALVLYDYAAGGKQDRNQQATVWIGGLEDQCSEELVWELMVQAGPVVSITMPRDKITQTHQGYAFCEFLTPQDADYAARVMNMVKVYGKQIRVNKAAVDSKQQDEQGFSANLFVGNLDVDCDEKLLHDTFSAFGAVLSAKIVTEESGQSRGFGFVVFDSFESGDAAIESMNGQYLCNRPLNVSYAFKKDGTKGERHGSAAERLLAKESEARGMPRPKAAPTMPMAMPPRPGGAAPAGAPGGMIGAPSHPPPMPGMPGMPPMPPGMPGMPPMPPMPGMPPMP